MDNIICPHCGKDVEISEAIMHKVQNQVREEESKKIKAEFEKEKEQLKKDQEVKLRAEFENENKLKEKELIEAKKKEEMLLEKIAKDAEERFKTEEKIKEEAYKQASDKSRLEKLEFEKKINDMQKALEEAQRKGKQGSQQLQGEVLELDFEQRLKSTFPNDEFLPVPKGVEGGDIWQKIKYQGKIVGSIIWETKRTKAWSKGWVTKLKEDAGRISATEAIIVSQILPDESNSFDRIDGVWITTYENALSICRYVRFLITSVFQAKSSVNQSEEQWAQIRDYMMSDSFKNRMQLHFQNINSLRILLNSEIRTTNIKWKKQEAIINKMDSNTSTFYGELQAIVPNLPEIKEIDTLLTDGEEEPQLL